MIRHELTHTDLVGALERGFDRETAARTKGRRDTGIGQRLPTGDSIFQHLNAACGELAAGRVRGAEWLGWTERYDRPDRGPDLADGTEVKTRTKVRDDLPIRHTIWKPCRYARRYVLLWGTLPTFTYVGSISGAELMALLATRKPNREGVKFLPWDLLQGDPHA